MFFFLVEYTYLNAEYMRVYIHIYMYAYKKMLLHTCKSDLGVPCVVASARSFSVCPWLLCQCLKGWFLKFSDWISKSMLGDH